MKHASLWSLAALLCLSIPTPSCWAEPIASAPTAAPLTSNPSTDPSSPFLNRVPSAPSVDAKSYVLMDAHTGNILASHLPDERVAPASLTKIMTVYVIADALRQGRIHLDDQVYISEKAWRTGGSKMFVKVGDKVPLRELVNGIVVSSGNDASVAVAEHIAGTEEAFAELMNQYAKKLGMTHSHFMDSNGLPNAEHYSTARDFALLAHALIRDFPQEYAWFSQKWFIYNNIRQPNRNRLLWREPWVDGIKTGHTQEAGYCLVSSGVRHGLRLISVVMGSPSERVRTESSLKLLNFGHHFYERRTLYSQGQSVATPRIWYGKSNHVKVGFPSDLAVTLTQGSEAQIKPSITISDALKAPIRKGDVCGHYRLTLGNQIILDQPLVALEDVPRANVFSRMGDYFALAFHRIARRGESSS